MATINKTQGDLANAILGLTYGDLMNVCGAFADMTDADNGARPRPRTAEHFAALLHDWAEAQEEDRR